MVEIVPDAVDQTPELMARRYRTRLPQPHNDRVPIFWWVAKWNYTKFILRELSSVSIGFYVVVLTLQIAALGRGPDSFEALQAALKAPIMIALHLIALAFLLLHAFTWFNLAPRAMVIKVGRRRLPPLVIAASNYAAWIVVSAILAWIVVGLTVSP